jgi:hypothetical protein
MEAEWKMNGGWGMILELIMDAASPINTHISSKIERRKFENGSWFFAI